MLEIRPKLRSLKKQLSRTNTMIVSKDSIPPCRKSDETEGQIVCDDVCLHGIVRQTPADL